MSIRLMADLWDNGDQELSGAKLLIMLCLADHANDDGVAWPSIARIAERTRSNTRTVRRLIQQLETMGYVTVDREEGKGNLYRICTTTQGVRPHGVTDPGSFVQGPRAFRPPLHYRTIKESSSRRPDDEPEQPDPEGAGLVEHWNKVFADTAWAGNPPVQNFAKWIDIGDQYLEIEDGGAALLRLMMEKAEGKQRPDAWLWRAYDNWQRAGDVPQWAKAELEQERANAAPVVVRQQNVVWPDGSTSVVEVETRG